MLRVGDFNIQKERIISLIKMKGPSLPVQVAKGIGVAPLFAGAFLSELYNEKRVRMSGMRVGSSPLYFLEGQDAMLENFVEHLNIREREAFFLLKKSGVLEEDALTPVIRVALRAIKDFAIPVKVRFKEGDKIFWRYFLLNEDEARRKIQRALSPEVIEKKIEVREAEKLEVREEIKPIDVHVSAASSSVGIARQDVVADKSAIQPDKKIGEDEEKRKDVIEKAEVKEKVREKTKKKSFKKEGKIKVVENVFPRKIREYLSAKDMEILETLLEKKREFVGKVRLDMQFGKQEFYLVAKEKKSISDNDLAIALQNAQTMRMPVLVVSNGALNKKAQDYLKEWRNLIKFEKVKI